MRDGPPFHKEARLSFLRVLHSATMSTVVIEIRPPQTDAERWAAADIMASSSPWTVYGRGREGTFKQIVHPTAEALVALRGGEVVGVTVVAVEVPLIRGYVWALAVREDQRGHGVGSRLLNAAEERIFRDSPNVFLCVTSFNERAQRLYARRGYVRVGTLTDYVLPGVDEYLLRKTLGPTKDYYGPQQAVRES